MNPKHKLFLLFSLFGLAISACSLDFTTLIKPNGSGVFTINVAVDDEDISYIEAQEGLSIDAILLDRFDTSDKKEACKELAENNNLPLPAIAKYRKTSTVYSCEISMSFVSLDELVDIYDEIFEGLTGNVSMNELGELNYVLNIEPNKLASAEELGVPKIEYGWSVSVPGNISEHNAQKIRENLLTWELQPDETTAIEVISTPKSDAGFLSNGFPIWAIILVSLACLCLLGIVFVGAVIYFVMRKR